MDTWYDGLLILGYGVGFFYLLVNPAKIANANAFRRAFQRYSSLSCTLAGVLASCVWTREARDIRQWIAVAFWGLFLYSLLQL